MRRRSSSSVRVFYPGLSREEVLTRLREGLARLQALLPLRLAVLFGSYARGNYHVGSDVDLLLVYRGGEAGGRLRPRLEGPLDVPRLEIHIYTEEEYERLKPTLERMTEGGVVLLER
ncbi:MAG: hypothetical protein KatS3mg131_1979 [Candidatus Tectimicrobiota bacterium]|nr:MAG: hypothetical protein KatS3mg131_1979 [Candidatus Tectomicrobia bacterium]